MGKTLFSTKFNDFIFLAMDDYKIREVTKDDKEDVIKLHEGDLDYLPAYYNYFLQATHIHPVVMEYKKQIVNL